MLRLVTLVVSLLEGLLAVIDFETLIQTNFIEPLGRLSSNPASSSDFSPHCGTAFFYDQTCIGQDGKQTKETKVKAFTSVWDTSKAFNDFSDNPIKLSKEKNGKTESFEYNLGRLTYKEFVRTNSSLVESLEWYQYYSFLCNLDIEEILKAAKKLKVTEAYEIVEVAKKTEGVDPVKIAQAVDAIEGLEFVKKKAVEDAKVSYVESRSATNKISEVKRTVEAATLEKDVEKVLNSENPYTSVERCEDCVALMQVKVLEAIKVLETEIALEPARTATSVEAIKVAEVAKLLEAERAFEAREAVKAATTIKAAEVAGAVQMSKATEEASIARAARVKTASEIDRGFAVAEAVKIAKEVREAKAAELEKNLEAENVSKATKAIVEAKNYSKTIHACIYEWWNSKHPVLKYLPYEDEVFVKGEISKGLLELAKWITFIKSDVIGIYRYISMVLFFNNELKTGQECFVSEITNDQNFNDEKDILFHQDKLQGCVDRAFEIWNSLVERMDETKNSISELKIDCENTVIWDNVYKYLNTFCAVNKRLGALRESLIDAERLLNFWFLLSSKTVVRECEEYEKEFALFEEGNNSRKEKYKEIVGNNVEATIERLKILNQEGNVFLSISARLPKLIDKCIRDFFRSESVKPIQKQIQKKLFASTMRRALFDVIRTRSELLKKMIIPDFMYMQGYVLYLAKSICDATSDKLDIYVNHFYSDNSILSSRIIYLSSGIVSLPVLLKALGDKMLSENHEKLNKTVKNEDETVRVLFENSTEPSAVIDFYVSMRLNNLDVSKLLKTFSKQFKEKAMTLIQSDLSQDQLIWFKVAFFTWAILHGQKQGWASMYSDKKPKILWERYVNTFKDEFIKLQDSFKSRSACNIILRN